MKSLYISGLLLLINSCYGGNPYFSCTVTNVPTCPPDKRKDMNNEHYDENTDVGVTVYTLEALDSDNDTVTFGKVRSSVRDSGFEDGYDWLNVNSSSGDVSFSSNPDYEKANKFEITWTLSDGKSTVEFQNIKIYLDDLNDNSPIFKELFYTFYLPENATEGFIGNVTATDLDSGPNGEITYSLTDVSDIFDMLENGDLVVKNSSSLDYESQVIYSFQANAMDSGSPRNSAKDMATIRISIQDVNDVPPEFRALPYITQLKENADVGTRVIKIDARDGDRGVAEKNTILYTLINETSGHFNISEISGQIYVANNIDKEDMTDNAYTFQVQVVEEETNQMSETDVIVTIEDVNDNIPIFTPAYVVYKVDENTPPGNLIYLNMTVKDADGPGNNKFSFSLKGGNGTFQLREPDRIYISETTVVLVVREELDFETGNNRIQLNITAIDTGQQMSEMNVGEVVIEIKDLNDNSPKFDDDIYKVEIPEDSSSGEHVIRIVATDEDVGSNITYKLIGAESDVLCFNVSKYSGYVTVSGNCEFDVEKKKSSYFFTYQATDDGGLPSTVLLEVGLTDVNDNKPVYEGVTPAFPTILENEFDNSTEIATVKFTDSDINKTTNGFVEYYLDSNGTIFRIDIITGVIYQTEAADYETKDLYSLLVVAKDRGTPTQSTNITIEIEVGDVNDNRPVFNQAIYIGKINETADNGASILTVNATDADSDYQNKQIDYEIQNNEEIDGKFFIDRIYGTITKSGSLDWDWGKREYNLTVIATDRGDNPLTGSCIVLISVLDTNDELPVLENDEVSIREDANVSVIITTLKANDSDSNSKLVYSILETEAFNNVGAPVNDYSNDQFVLNSLTGQLILNNSLDQERIQEYRITVEVVDINGIEKQRDSAVITVNVIDVPDEQPYFWKSPDTGPVVQKVAIKEDVGEERHNDSCIASITSAGDDDQGDSIYYFIVEGNEGCSFHLQNDTGCMQVVKKVDREVEAVYTLIVKATNNMFYESGQKCSADSSRQRAMKSKFDPDKDSTLLKVEVQIVDENDNKPVFTQAEYTAGVTSTYNYGTSIVQLVAEDKDEGNNAVMEYQISKETRYIDDEPQPRIKKYFEVNPTNGWITLANLFDSEDTGYFELDVKVNGTGGFYDSSRVSIYLMNPSENQVKVVFDKTSEFVLEEEKRFSSIVSNATNYIINVDYINVHLDKDDKPMDTRSDMRIHAVNASTNKVIQHRRLITSIDEAYIIYAELKNTYRVLEVQKAVPDPPAVFDTLNALQWFFFTFCLVLLFILSLWAIAFGFWRSSLQRKLKVANAEIYKNVPKNPNLPNTNLFTERGANPLFINQKLEENDIDENSDIPSHASEASETASKKIEKLEEQNAIQQNEEDYLSWILKDYDKSRGIDNSGLEENEYMEVTDV